MSYLIEDIDTLFVWIVSCQRGQMNSSSLPISTLLTKLPGEPPEETSMTTWHPAQVLYGGAHRFHRGTPAKLQHLAREAWEEWSAAFDLLEVCGVDDRLSALERQRITELVAKRIAERPFDDLRIDFEDGLGPISDTEEDQLAAHAAEELTLLPPDHRPRSCGIRIKPLRPGSSRRALRTLETFLHRAQRAICRSAQFVVTLPKVVDAREVEVLISALHHLERAYQIPTGTVQVEVMVESPTALHPGRITDFVTMGSGRVRSVHFGTYDYLSELGVTAPEQNAAHPAARFARHCLQLQLAQTRTPLVDGATHLVPVAPHRARPGEPLTPAQRRANHSVVDHALRVHAQNVWRALQEGIFCGWDLHPAQLVARWCANVAFFRQDLDEQKARLAAYSARARAAARTGAMFDDAASIRGVWQTFRLGYQVGAIDDDDLRAAGMDSSLLEATQVPGSPN